MTETSNSTGSQSAPLSAMKVDQLKPLAAAFGIKGASKMKKGELVDAIRAARAANSSSSAAQGHKGRRSAAGAGAGQQQSSQSSVSVLQAAESRAENSPGAQAATASAAAGRAAQRASLFGSADRSEPVNLAGAGTQADSSRGLELGSHTRSQRGESQRDAQRQEVQRSSQSGEDRRIEGQRVDGQRVDGQRLEGQASDDSQQAGQQRRSRRVSRPAGSVDLELPRPATEAPGGMDKAARLEALAQAVATSGSRQGRQSRYDKAEGQDRSGQQDREQRATRSFDADAEGSDRPSRAAGRDRAVMQGSDDDRRRNRRDRSRDRKQRNRQGRGPDVVGGDEDIREDDVLIPIAGILDILDNYALVRTTGYLPGANDVYVTVNQMKRNDLRRGDAIVGAIRQPRESDSVGHGNRAKYNALVRIDSVNGMPVEQARMRPHFAKLTPLYPQERLRLENQASANKLTPRVIDLIAPIGKGQRGLIVSPPKAGKTLMMQTIANSITANNPEVHLMVVLVDERPEEVTDFERSVDGEVIASTFDRHASDHAMVAELAIERAKRLVELGQDVVVLLDGITRLSRAYNLAAPASGRILSGGVDAAALYPPKKFFGAARNIENGGSLTILATALVETGSKMDEVIFEEFKGTGNMELRLSRSLAEKRIYPAIDVNASSTRREEILLSREELSIIYKLRRVMGALDQQQATELLLGKLKETATNVEFLLQVQKTTPGAIVDNAGETL